MFYVVGDPSNNKCFARDWLDQPTSCCTSKYVRSVYHFLRGSSGSIRNPAFWKVTAFLVLAYMPSLASGAVYSILQLLGGLLLLVVLCSDRYPSVGVLGVALIGIFLICAIDATMHGIGMTGWVNDSFG